MNQEEIRKQFERLVTELNSGVLLERNPDDSYKASLPQYMWWSYQAALSSKQEHTEGNQELAQRLRDACEGEL